MNTRYYENFNINGSGYVITMRKEIYTKSKSGKSWKTNPSLVAVETIDGKFYSNYVQSIPFFNRFGYGAYCRPSFGYCYAGYLPLTITTVNPGQTEKHIVRFSFELKH